MAPTILIVDDERHTREGLRTALEDRFDVYVAGDIGGAVSVLQNETIDLMVTDLRLGGEDGMQLIDRALKMPHAPICIMMTAYGSVDTAVEAMKHGAYDFVTKPINIDRLEILIQRALRGRETEKENRELKQQVEKRYGLENLIGSSAVMQEVFDTVKQIAPTRATILIEGESGTGKELVAQAIHHLSNRNKAKFIAVHCAALSENLLESELFGHEKGAFTGAMERRIGRFEQANGGTLFLDEIGEIDANTQVKILRALDPGVFERVGGSQTIKTDVRLVAATNKSLEKLVREGKFRDDLFYRLNVVKITMPPLRDRKEDLPLLVSAFLKSFAKENGKPFREFTSDAMQAILAYDWPGNVRELRTTVEHGVVMATGPRIALRDLPAPVREAAGGKVRGFSPGSPGQPYNLHDTSHRLIERALTESNGNVTEAARKLGISRRTLHRKLKSLREEQPPQDDPASQENAPGRPPEEGPKDGE
ncbi:MAG TPA: sigma-54 dependent transcriptional regulator [Chthoniobacteraceae bacterium]|jgi:DNA-binding NtrC family response regulator|nr:sigma-54 dependent transcriptional regulator [Chthoniobacteraceae bacterium]